VPGRYTTQKNNFIVPKTYKKYGKAFSGAFPQRMFLPSAFPYFFVSCSTDNDFMNPVNTGYSLVN
jgi:hypothetical protein